MLLCPFIFCFMSNCNVVIGYIALCLFPIYNHTSSDSTYNTMHVPNFVCKRKHTSIVYPYMGSTVIGYNTPGLSPYNSYCTRQKMEDIKKVWIHVKVFHVSCIGSSFQTCLPSFVKKPKIMISPSQHQIEAWCTNHILLTSVKFSDHTCCPGNYTN